MKYESYQYLYPPRPERAIPVEQLSFFEKRGWVGQMKKNGTCTVLFVTPDKKVITKTRHNADHKMWNQNESRALEIFENLPGDNWYVFVVETLHNKTSIIKDTLYIFDILVDNGELLVGSTFTERMDTLKELFNVVDEDNVVSLSNNSHYILNSNVWLARTITTGFEQIMRIANQQKPAEGAPLDEGIVLKDPNARLNMPGRAKSNGGWQVKCRISHKNYDF